MMTREDFPVVLNLKIAAPVLKNKQKRYANISA